MFLSTSVVGNSSSTTSVIVVSRRSALLLSLSSSLAQSYIVGDVQGFVALVDAVAEHVQVCGGYNACSVGCVQRSQAVHINTFDIVH